MTPEEIAALVKEILRHDRLLTLLAQAAGDQALLLLPKLDKCAKEICTNAATVEHKILGIKMCDRCASETIVKSGRLFTTDESDPINPVRSTLMREVDWEDVEGSESIRRTQEYVDLLKLKTAQPSKH